MSTSKFFGWSLMLRASCSLTASLAVCVAQLAGQTPPPLEAMPASQVTEVSKSDSTEPLFHIAATDSKVSMIQLQSKTLEFSKRIKEVDGFDPGILTITPVSPTQIRLRAETTGVTSMTVKDETGAMYKVEVFVEGDVRELRAYIERLFPGSAIEVVSLRESVILRGWVTDPTSIPQIVAVAKQMYPMVHNQMQVGGVSVVQLHVKILEVQRSKLKELGFNFVTHGRNYALGSSVGGLAPITAITATPGTPPIPSIGTSTVTTPLKFAITGNSDAFQGFVDALTTEALAKVLAEPTLVTTSGRPASLLSGGEFPILVPGAVGTVSVQFREFGVRMEAIPTVLGNGRLRLDIAPEVSERDFSSAVNIQGLVVPGMNTRRVNTQVEMSFGETIMIGGLISRKRITQSSKYPVIGEIPVIGALFSKRSHEVGETELLIMVTPEMAGPLRPDQVPHDAPGWTQDEPTDKEFFLDGMMEVPSYGSECQSCGEGVSNGMIYEHAGGNSGLPYQEKCSPVEQPAAVELTTPAAEGEVEYETAPPAPEGEIQTMSGRSGNNRDSVIQAGGDPFRVPTRKEIPVSSKNSQSKSKNGASKSSNRSVDSDLPGLASPQRTGPSRMPTSTRAKSNNTRGDFERD